MNAGSLFSGIGGLDCGLARAGFRHAFLCEQDPWRRGVLAERFPGVPVYDDVRAVRVESAAGGAADAHGSEPDGTGRVHADAVPVDLLCGGFPCQDLSVAGRRAGLQAGARSSLFFEFIRVADELVQPGGYVLIENVPGLLSSQRGRDFAIVLASLAELGFHDLAWRVLDSRYFGVPQRRRRVFVVGRRTSGRRAAEVLLEPEGGGGDSAAGGEAGAGVAFASLSGLGSGGPDDNDATQGRIVNTMTSRDMLAVGADAAAAGYLIADTLTSGSHPGSNMPGRRREDDTNIVAVMGDHTHALTSEGHDASEDGTGRGQPIVAYPLARRGREGGSDLEMGDEGTYNTLRAGDGGSSRLNQVLTGTVRSHPRPGSNTSTEILDGAAVRRLTPVECERLQGLPDNWTLVPDTAPDSRRYAGLGDAVTATVGHWLGARLLEIEARYAKDAA